MINFINNVSFRPHVILNEFGLYYVQKALKHINRKKKNEAEFKTWKVGRISSDLHFIIKHKF